MRFVGNELSVREYKIQLKVIKKKKTKLIARHF